MEDKFWQTIEKEEKPQEGTVLDTANSWGAKPKDRFNPDNDIRADLWKELCLNDLWRQKITLQNRINICNNVGHPALAQQLEAYMTTLEVQIHETGAKEKAKSDQLSVFL